MAFGYAPGALASVLTLEMASEIENVFASVFALVQQAREGESLSSLEALSGCLRWYLHRF